MRASRLLSIVLLLQNRGRMTAQELADELEVSVRTIYRDMGSLGAAGIPIYGDSGHSGGFSLVDGYRTRLTGLPGDEAEALALAGLPGPAAELGLGAVLAAAELKLTVALPSGLRGQTGRIRERFHLDSPGRRRDAEPLPHLADLAGAVWEQRPIRVRYLRWAVPQEVDRALDPYGIVLKGSIWYLVAGDSAGDGSIRTYRVSQILALSVENATFERPAGFDLAEHWQSSQADSDARRLRGQAAVRLAPDALSRLPELFEPAIVRAVRESAEPPGEDGWIRAVLPIESVAHAVPQLLRLGGEVEVLTPPELRRALAAAAALILAHYAGDH